MCQTHHVAKLPSPKLPPLRQFIPRPILPLNPHNTTPDSTRRFNCLFTPLCATAQTESTCTSFWRTKHVASGDAPLAP